MYSRTVGELKNVEQTLHLNTRRRGAIMKVTVKPLITYCDGRKCLGKTRLDGLKLVAQPEVGVGC